MKHSIQIMGAQAIAVPALRRRPADPGRVRWKGRPFQRLCLSACPVHVHPRPEQHRPAGTKRSPSTTATKTQNTFSPRR